MNVSTVRNPRFMLAAATATDGDMRLRISVSNGLHVSARDLSRVTCAQRSLSAYAGFSTEMSAANFMSKGRSGEQVNG